MNATADGTTCCSDVPALQARVSLCVSCVRDKKVKNGVQLTQLAKNTEPLGGAGVWGECIAYPCCARRHFLLYRAAEAPAETVARANDHKASMDCIQMYRVSVDS